jgi:hypothetical protein
VGHPTLPRRSAAAAAAAAGGGGGVFQVTLSYRCKQSHYPL